jgi:ribosomal protein L12E/L44/L45/RPP1/RPP2
MGIRAHAEETAVAPSANSNNNDESNMRTSDASEQQSGEKHSEEPTFDTGFLAWLQVVGSFFLFFNSW